MGPTKDGKIIPLFQERLLQLGEWLELNGQAIYETQPWTLQNDTVTPAVWYTSNSDSVYAIVLNWPQELLALGLVELFDSENIQVELIGYEGDIIVCLLFHFGKK